MAETNTDAPSAAPDRRAILPALLGLGLTSLIGWGSTFSPLQILGARMGAELRLSPEQIFSGITLMMLTGALVGPTIGRRIDRDGGRRVLMLGSLIMALSHTIVATAQNYLTYAVGWVGLGFAMACALTTAAVPTLVQIAGPRSRRAVTAFTIVTGVTSTISMPLAAWFEARYGWRNVFLIYAALHLFVCFPIHALVLPRARPSRVAATSTSVDATWEGRLPEKQRMLCFWLIALWTSVQSLVVWGFNLQAVNVFLGLGLTQSAAIGVWMLSGPSQAIVRTGELFNRSGRPIHHVAILSAILAPVGFALFLTAGTSTLTAALLAIHFGAGLGLYAIVRQMIPLRLFGIAGFGTISGRLSLPQNIATAVAPLIFASVLGSFGPVAACILALACGLISLLALLALVRIARASGS